MTIIAHKRLNIALSLVILFLLVLGGTLIWHYGWLSIEVAFASGQTEIFEEMRNRAIQSDPVSAAGCLRYAVNYYPSGTKQRTGSRVDRMVEQQRAMVVREILAYLRVKTGEDLGPSPEPWIQKYAANGR